MRVNEPVPSEPAGVPVYSPTCDCASNISLLSDAVGNFGRGGGLRSLRRSETPRTGARLARSADHPGPIIGNRTRFDAPEQRR